MKKIPKLLLFLSMMSFGCQEENRSNSELHKCLTESQDECLDLLRKEFLKTALKYDHSDTNRGIMLFLEDPERGEAGSGNYLVSRCLVNSGLGKKLKESHPNSRFSSLIHNTQICECAGSHELVRQWCDRIVTAGDLSPEVYAEGALTYFTCNDYQTVEVQEILALTFTFPLY